MNWDDLHSRFPELEPINRVPLLGQLFGCGLILFGGRDEDPEFGTIVRTRYLCVLFIPILALGAYRMARTDRGWAILGRQPISTPALWLNTVVLLSAIAGGAVYGVHTLINSDWYVARRQVERADALVAAGRGAEAAGLYENVAMGDTDYASDAVSRLAHLVAPDGPKIEPGDAAAVLKASASLLNAGRWPRSAPNLYRAGLSRVNDLATGDPRAPCSCWRPWRRWPRRANRPPRSPDPCSSGSSPNRLRTSRWSCGWRSWTSPRITSIAAPNVWSRFDPNWGSPKGRASWG